MKTISVSALKSRLSEFLRLVREGERIMVMDRGRPVAWLGPCEGADDLDAELIELRDAGLVRAGSGKIPQEYWTRPKDKDPTGLLLAALLENREEDR